MALLPSHLRYTWFPASSRTEPCIPSCRSLFLLDLKREVDEFSGQRLICQVRTCTAATKEFADLTFPRVSSAELKKPSTFSRLAQSSAAIESRRTFRQRVDQLQPSIVVGALPILVPVAAINEQAYASQAHLAKTVAVVDRYSESIRVRAVFEVTLKRTRAGAAVAAVGDTIVRLSL